MKIHKAIFWIGLTAVLFMVSSLVSSSLQLIQGIEHDTNIHIILRFFVCGLTVLIMFLFTQVRLKSLAATIALQYLVSLGAMFLLVYFSGYFIELHRHAYRDIFLNYTAVFGLLAGAYVVFHKRRAKRLTSSGKTSQ